MLRIRTQNISDTNKIKIGDPDKPQLILEILEGLSGPKPSCQLQDNTFIEYLLEVLKITYTLTLTL